MVELIKALNLLPSDGDIVKNQVIYQPISHTPQNLWLLKHTWSRNGYVLNAVQLLNLSFTMCHYDCYLK